MVAIQGAKPTGTRDAQQQLERTTKWIKEKDYPFPVLLDPTAAYQASLDLPAGPYPLLCLLDQEGTVRWIGGTGPGRKGKECDAQLAQLMASAKQEAAGGGEAPR